MSWGDRAQLGLRDALLRELVQELLDLRLPLVELVRGLLDRDVPAERPERAQQTGHLERGGRAPLFF